MMRRAIWSLAVLCGLGALPAMAEWEVVAKLENVNGRLGDLQPDKASYSNLEFYDETTGKFYSVWPLRIGAGKTLVLDLYSYDFQPAALVRTKENVVQADGVVQEPRWAPEAQRNSYRIHLEFTATDDQESELLVYTKEKNLQGGFNLVWSIWQQKPEAPVEGGATTEGGTTTEGTTGTTGTTGSGGTTTN